MVTYTTPGVYISETEHGPGPIEAVSTSNTAFIGETQKGPLDEAKLIKSYADFEQHYGGVTQSSWLSRAVQQYFSNGGYCLYIARVDPTDSTPIEERYHAAFDLLDELTDISLIAAPGRGTPEILRFGAQYCERRGDCFYIGEMAQSDHTVDDAREFLGSLNSQSTYAAVYFPWLVVKHEGKTLTVPPSGAIAGLYARTDRYRGVWKAPAGVEADLHNVIGLSAELNNEEHDLLNPLGVNVIRDLPNIGIVVMGARTVGTRTAGEWKYVPVRRTAIYIERSIDKGTQWAVFEPNGEALWKKLELAITAFMNQLYRQGAFAGMTSDKAFMVHCDNRVNTPDNYDPEVVYIQVGFAPLKPAEFIILRLKKYLGT
jgi:phage tail sheath protein FI